MKTSHFLCFMLVLSFLPTAATSQGLSGEWRAILFLGSVDAELQTTFFLRQKGQELHGHSTPGAANRILGLLKGEAASLFVRQSFEKGALLHLREGAIQGDSVVGMLHTLVGTFQLKGEIQEDTIYAGLFRKSRLMGGLVLRRNFKSTPEVVSYPALTADILELTGTRLYSQEPLRSEEYQRFSRKLQSFSQKAKDDVEYFFAFYYYARQGKHPIPFSHYYLGRRRKEVPLPAEQEGNRPSAAPKVDMNLSVLQDSIALLRIPTFGTHPVAQIDSLLGLIKAKAYPVCIIDLRNNTGGSISSMRIAQHLADTVFYGGFFLTSKWFGQHSGMPGPAEYEQLEILEESNLQQLWAGIHESEGFKLKVIPVEAPYNGKVYVLTNKNTASACEPLCFGLQFYGRATLVGQNTAGAMLNGENFSADDGWYLTLPTADFYTVNGQRLEGVGVKPDILTAPGAELEAVMQLLGK